MEKAYLPFVEIWPAVVTSYFCHSEKQALKPLKSKKINR
jgi:hypothetical protein